MIYRYFLAVWILTSSAVAGQSTQYGLLGETVTFRTDITDPPDDILWKHNGNKVVQFDGNEQIAYNPFQNRITLDWHSADLEINQLTHSDSGQYELDAGKKGGLSRLNFELKVLDSVTKPTITCNMRDGSSSDKSGSEATLMCSADPSQSLKYEWSQPGKIESGQTLTIPLGRELDDKVYTCTASNLLSKEIATFTAKNCYPVGASVGLITGVVIGVIALLLCVLGGVFCALKRKARIAKEEKTDEEKQPHREHLLHREETMPSKQPLRHLAEMGKNQNFDHNDEKHTESDPLTGKSKVMALCKKFEQGLTESDEEEYEDANASFNNDDGASANQPSSPLNNNPPVVGEDANSDQVTGEKEEENESDDMIEKKESATIPEQTGQNNKGKPAVPKKPPSVKIKKVQADINPLRKDKVSECGYVKEHSGATESDLQSATASEKPVMVLRKKCDQGLTDPVTIETIAENVEDVNSDQVTGEKEEENESDDMIKKKESATIPEQTGQNNKGKPAVPKKPPSVKIKKVQADINPLRKDKVSECGYVKEHSGATESDLQSATASEKPGTVLRKKCDQGLTDPVTIETIAENVEDVNSDQVTGEKEENESDDMIKKKESATIPEQTVMALCKKFEQGLTESDEEEYEDANASFNNDDGASANQPSSPLNNNPPVVGEDANSDQVTGEKEEENESDDMIEKKESATIPEQTGQNNKGKPAVPKKPPSVKIKKVQADINPLRKDKVSECGYVKEHSGATESDLQSATASEKPVKNLAKKFDQRLTDPVTIETIVENVEDVNSDQVTGEKEEENESDDMIEKKESATIPEQTVKNLAKKFEQGLTDPVAIETIVEKEKEDSESDDMTTTISEQTDSVKKADDNQMAAPENAGELLSTLTPASPKMASNNDAGEHVDDSNSEQATGEPHEENVGTSSGSGEGNKLNGKEESSNIAEQKTGEA